MGTLFIRARKKQGDHRHLVRLIEEELIPHAKKARPDLNVSRSEIGMRLQKGNIWVLSKRARGSHPIGFILFHKHQDEVRIEMLAVDRKYQARGYGGRLMDAVEQYGREKGCRAVKLFVDEPNQIAQKFYFGRGYVISNYYSAYRCYGLIKLLTD